MKKLFVLLAVFSASVASANQAVLTWTHPTQNTDGSVLALNQIARTEAEYGLCNATKTGFLTTPAPRIVSVLPPPATTTITGLAAGTWCFRARTVSTLSTTPSDWTGFVSKVVLPPVPQPPSNLAIAADTSAYAVVKRVDRFALVKVGDALPGTLCIADQQVNGFYVVPRASVKWSGTVRPDVVVASCS